MSNDLEERVFDAEQFHVRMKDLVIFIKYDCTGSLIMAKDKDARNLTGYELHLASATLFVAIGERLKQSGMSLDDVAKSAHQLYSLYYMYEPEKPNGGEEKDEDDWRDL